MNIYKFVSARSDWTTDAFFKVFNYITSSYKKLSDTGVLVLVLVDAVNCHIVDSPYVDCTRLATALSWVRVDTVNSHLVYSSLQLLRLVVSRLVLLILLVVSLFCSVLLCSRVVSSFHPV
jgi:hypothetical protein